jgi:hypothetical protein
MESAAREITRQESRGALLLWFGVFAGPAAWVLHLMLGYMTEDVIACTPGSSTQGEILGFGVRPVVIAINVVLISATLLALVVSIAAWRRLRASDDRDREARPAWMALVGIMDSALFALIIAGGFVPPLVLDVCRSTL